MTFFLSNWHTGDCGWEYNRVSETHLRLEQINLNRFRLCPCCKCRRLTEKTRWLRPLSVPLHSSPWNWSHAVFPVVEMHPQHRLNRPKYLIDGCHLNDEGTKGYYRGSREIIFGCNKYWFSTWHVPFFPHPYPFILTINIKLSCHFFFKKNVNSDSTQSQKNLMAWYPVLQHF